MAVSMQTPRVFEKLGPTVGHIGGLDRVHLNEMTAQDMVAWDKQSSWFPKHDGREPWCFLEQMWRGDFDAAGILHDWCLDQPAYAGKAHHVLRRTSARALLCRTVYDWIAHEPRLTDEQLKAFAWFSGMVTDGVTEDELRELFRLATRDNHLDLLALLTVHVADLFVELRPWVDQMWVRFGLLSTLAKRRKSGWQRQLNRRFLQAQPLGESDQLTNKAAIDAVNEFTRIRMRENGFFRRLIPPVQLTNDELDRSVPSYEPIMVSMGSQVVPNAHGVPVTTTLRGQALAHSMTPPNVRPGGSLTLLQTLLLKAKDNPAVGALLNCPLTYYRREA